MANAQRIIAIDWSGAASGAAKTIWLAEVGTEAGCLVRMENGRDREEIADWIVAEARDRGPLIVGLDFAFEFPAWFMHERGWRNGPECWEALHENGELAEQWLSECKHPFWGKPGSTKPRGVELSRACERGGSAKSVFQIGGAGAVGTGSLRGMGVLHRLHEAGLVVWPFAQAKQGQSMVVEIYPRELTGPVVKSDAEARYTYLDKRFSSRLGGFAPAAARSEDAFDAAVSAMVMWDHRKEFSELRVPVDAACAVEGAIWSPSGTGSRAVQQTARITVNPDVMTGKPVVAGTRLTVEYVLTLLAQGWSVEQVVEEHARLTREDVQACLAYAVAHLPPGCREQFDNAIEAER